MTVVPDPLMSLLLLREYRGGWKMRQIGVTENSLLF